MNKILFILVFVFCYSCVSSKNKHTANALPVNRQWVLMKGKIENRVYNFFLDSSQCLKIRFQNKKFRKADGSFSIIGMALDTNSVYHTTTPYVGFFNTYEKDSVVMYWFKNISWSMDFNKHNLGGEIGSLFLFKGRYAYNSESLIFFKEREHNFRDTVIVLKSEN